MALFAGIDIGTTSTIGILVDERGGVVARATRDCDLHSVKPTWAEEDPAQWWDNTCAILQEMLAGRDAGEVAAVGITGMVPALVLLDGDGEVLRRSIQQNDARTTREVTEMAQEVDAAAFLAKTGNGVNQQLVAPRLRWLARHEPELLARARTMFGSYDYIAWKLTGERCVEHNWALEAGFMDVARNAVDADLVALGRCDAAIMPEVRASHEIAGQVTPEAAAATGLKAGTPVVAGCADHVASAFVAGVVDPGDLLIKFGGAGDVLLASPKPVTDPRMFLDFHIVPGLYLTNGCMAASGSVLKWIARHFAGAEAAAAEQAGESVFARLDRMAADVGPGAGGVVLLPYFLGEKTPLHDPFARGTLVGLALHHHLGHVWRAALEAVVFGFRHHIDVFADMGLPVTRVVASDGGSQSRLWMQIAADALGQPVQLVTGHPGSCLGAAYVAAMGVGAFDGWDEIGRYVARGELIAPDSTMKARYDEAYGIYRETYERLKPLYPRLSALGEDA